MTIERRNLQWTHEHDASCWRTNHVTADYTGSWEPAAAAAARRHHDDGWWQHEQPIKRPRAVRWTLLCSALAEPADNRERERERDVKPRSTYNESCLANIERYDCIISVWFPFAEYRSSSWIKLPKLLQNYQSQLSVSYCRTVYLLLELLFVKFGYLSVSCQSQADITYAVDSICISWCVMFFMVYVIFVLRVRFYK